MILVALIAHFITGLPTEPVPKCPPPEKTEWHTEECDE